MILLLRSLRARFGRHQSGATSIEYAILAAGIALVIVSAVQTLGTQLNALYTSVQAAFP
jgi:pilus assembly protein Flp/PilA